LCNEYTNYGDILIDSYLNSCQGVVRHWRVVAQPVEQVRQLQGDVGGVLAGLKLKKKKFNYYNLDLINLA